MKITNAGNNLTVTGLRHDYLKIDYFDNFSYGGCQNWFENSENGEIIKKQGCGLIAISDAILYLAAYNDNCSSPMTKSFSINNTIDYNDYMNFVIAFNKRYVNLNKRLNIDINLSGHKFLSIHTNSIDGRMGKILNNYFSDNSIALKAEWGLSDCSIYYNGNWFEKNLRLKRIKKMLINDIPAIVSVGPGISGKMKGINCYEINKNEHTDKIIYKNIGQKIINHYFTVTAVIEDEAKKRNGDFDSVMYEVSSWGRKYYVAESEIKRFSRYNSSLFTNVLYIKEKV